MADRPEILRRLETAARKQAKHSRLASWFEGRRHHFEKVENQARKAMRRNDPHRHPDERKAFDAAVDQLHRAQRKQTFHRTRRDLHLRRRAKWNAIRKDWKKTLKQWRDAHSINWFGHEGLHGAIARAVAYAERVTDTTVTSTTGGTHAATSWHYQRRAADLAPDQADVQQALLDHFGAHYFLELFGPLGWHVKNGVVYQGAFPDHGDHCHAAA